MIKLRYSTRYLSERKKFLKNNPKLLEKTIKTITNFSLNPSYPALNVEKLKGAKVWTIRIDKGNRIFFIWENKQTAIFIDIGTHNKYRYY